MTKAKKVPQVQDTGKMACRPIPTPPSIMSQLKKNPVGVIGQISASLSMGTVFGVLLHKSRVFEGIVIRDQMLLKRFLMMKMFLGAVIGGKLVFSFLSLLPSTKHMFESARTYTASTTATNKAVIVGGALLGLGMTVSGACPGMVLAQVGSMAPSSIITLLGCTAGALVYGLAQPAIQADAHTRYIAGHSPSTDSVHESVGVPYYRVAIPMAMALSAVVAGLEFMFPWYTEVGLSSPPRELGWTSPVWPPAQSGFAIGLLQLPAVLLLGKTIGSSSSYVTAVSSVLPLQSTVFDQCALLRMKQGGLGNWWQVMYVCGAMLGAYASASASGTLGQGQAVSPVAGFLGGAALLFGSRLAGGCTSGHGLSGFGMLSQRSILAVCAMFAGGIGGAFALRSVGLIS